MDFESNIFVFLLATFLGLDIIRRVSPLLHTPLMSLTNAISAISVVGAIVIAGQHYPPGTPYATLAKVLGVAAVTLAFSNVVGGYLITDRMLKMFKGGRPKLEESPPAEPAPPQPQTPSPQQSRPEEKK